MKMQKLFKELLQIHANSNKQKNTHTQIDVLKYLNKCPVHNKDVFDFTVFRWFKLEISFKIRVKVSLTKQQRKTINENE